MGAVLIGSLVWSKSVDGVHAASIRLVSEYFDAQDNDLEDKRAEP